jgi:N6-adenosine-specific RNA methylase IME4
LLIRRKNEVPLARPPFAQFKRHSFKAILADPSWNFKTYSPKGRDRSIDKHYAGMDLEAISALPVADLAAPDCALFIWATWPMLTHALGVIADWGFEYKTCAFAWMKINANGSPFCGLGFWTRANTEPCLLATRGKPKRLSAAVPQAVLEGRQEHSRKPSVVGERIERLVAGPYIELFARNRRKGWSSWGHEVDKFPELK